MFVTPRRLASCRTPWLLLAILAGTALLACDTPVYRYAMYRWQAAPYEVYYFFDGETPEPRAKQHDVLRELPYDKQPANLAMLDIDLQDQDAYGRLPTSIREAWEGAGVKAPGYLIYSPQGGKVYSGALEVADLQQLTESPARAELAKQLGAGKVGVLMLLAASEQGDDEAAVKEARERNEVAQSELQSALKKIAAGDVPLYGFGDEDAAKHAPKHAHEHPGKQQPPTVSVGASNAEKANAKATKPSDEKPEVGWLRVDRDDPAERWLVRSLLAIEPDLHEEQFLRQPMVFMVYGRGRALPPWVGKGIRGDNLVGDVQFVSGACSCTVKDKNPGVDLLVRHNWEQAAETLAARFGSEEGNESQLGVGELFPSLSLPPNAPVDSAAPPADAKQETVETEVETKVETKVEGGDTESQRPVAALEAPSANDVPQQEPEHQAIANADAGVELALGHEAAHDSHATQPSSTGPDEARASYLAIAFGAAVIASVFVVVMMLVFRQ